jgi:hypothetical protein
VGYGKRVGYSYRGGNLGMWLDTVPRMAGAPHTALGDLWIVYVPATLEREDHRLVARTSEADCRSTDRDKGDWNDQPESPISSLPQNRWNGSQSKQTTQLRSCLRVALRRQLEWTIPNTAQVMDQLVQAVF